MSWNTSQLYTSGVLTAVPEPGGMLLLVTSGMLLGAAPRGKRAAPLMGC